MAIRFHNINAGDDVHTVFRTINREFLFSSNDDHQLFLKALQRQKKRYDAPIYAWTGMSNHHHVFNQVASQWHQDTDHARIQRANGETFPPDAMVRDTQSYFASLYNLTHQRDGGIVRDRTKMIKVFGDRHALALLIYVFLNPVRAGIVRHPDDYHFSNFHQYAYGFDNFKELFTLHSAYERLGSSPALRQTCFRALVEQAGRAWAKQRWPGASGAHGFGRSVGTKAFQEFFSTTYDWFNEQKIPPMSRL